ncbi:MAG: AhpC/TSA family protein [Chitinophagaceae bacterium]|nr:AhpC/TSA family protein [Chitinophagaceae bacterium]
MVLTKYVNQIGRSFFFTMIILCSILYLVGCTYKIKIEGHITNLPGDKIYLMQKGVDDIAIDSAFVKNNYFLIEKKVKKSDTPKLVKLKINDSNCLSCYHPLYLGLGKNQENSKNYPRNIFYLEKAPITIQGDYKSSYLKFKAGKQNILLFGTEKPVSYWEIDTMNEQLRLKSIENIKKLIKLNSNSIFYFDNIYNSKNYFTTKELKEIYPLFNSKILNSVKGEKLINYYRTKMGDTIPYSNFQLIDSTLQLRNVLASNSKIAILIFWATWCIPCRQEIPLLQKLFKKFSDKKIQFISISIDEEQEKWVTEIRKLKMPWEQFIIPQDSLNKWVERFDIPTIPSILVLSSDRRKIIQFYGFSENTEQTLDSLIQLNLEFFKK